MLLDIKLYYNRQHDHFKNLKPGIGINDTIVTPRLFIQCIKGLARVP